MTILQRIKFWRDMFPDYGDSRSLNRMYGKWRVLYANGETSEPMCYRIACGYAQLFHATVIHIQKP